MFGRSGALRRPLPKRQLRSSRAAIVLFSCTGEAASNWFSWDLVLRRRPTAEMKQHYILLKFQEQGYIKNKFYLPLPFLCFFLLETCLFRVSATGSNESPTTSLSAPDSLLHEQKKKNVIGQTVNDMYPAYCQIQPIFDTINFFLAENVFLFFGDIKRFSILRLLLEISHDDTRYLTLDSIRFSHVCVSSSPFGQSEML